MDNKTKDESKDNCRTNKKHTKRRACKRPFDQTEIARERIEILFSEAEKRFEEEPTLSDRYVELALKISTRYNVPIPKELKRRFCKKCKKFLVFGKNARIRVDSENKCIAITCISCENKDRYGYQEKDRE